MPTVNRDMVELLNGVRRSQGRPTLTETEAQHYCGEVAEPGRRPNIVEGSEDDALAALRRQQGREPVRG